MRKEKQREKWGKESTQLNKYSGQKNSKKNIKEDKKASAGMDYKFELVRLL